MPYPIRLVLVIIAVFVLTLWGLMALPSAAPKPKFVVGQPYVLLYSCINQVGCYGEVAVVKEAGDDWIVVLSQDGHLWTTQVSNLLAYTPYVAEQQAD